MNDHIGTILKSLPHTPGIYMYKDEAGVVIYVGKAIDLYRRVHQYFERNDAVGAKTLQLVPQITDIEIITTLSEFDALLLEAKLIAGYQPKYNVIAKDNKSPLYILLTFHEELPHIRFTRRRELGDHMENIDKDDIVFGPFQSSKVVRKLLRSLRYSIPYCTSSERNGKPCFYTHLGLCFPCASVISKLGPETGRSELVRQYRRNIYRLRDVLSGNSSRVIDEMTKEMNMLANEEEYEKAAAIRNQIQALYDILKKRYDPVVYMDGDLDIATIADAEIEELRITLEKFIQRSLPPLHRIECFDISNIQGLQATASMVVLSDGRINTSEYKKFKIRLGESPNDVAMMQEAVSRRLNHPEWSKMPDLLVVDGGKAQVSKISDLLKEKNLTIPLIGLAKRQEEIIVRMADGRFKILRLPLTSGALHALQRLRDEAHRFALTYHRLLRSKRQLPSSL